MNFKNLKLTFKTIGKYPITLYTWGKTKHELQIIEVNENFYDIWYNGKNIKGFKYLAKPNRTAGENIDILLPKILSIQVKQLFNGFGVDSREIESCIKSIQAWEKRKDRHV